MFKVSNPSIPQRTTLITFKTAPFSGGIIARKSSTPITYTSTPSSNLTVTGQTIAFNSNAPTGQIATIKIDNKTYYASKGDFTYNPSTKTIKFKVNVDLTLTQLIYSTLTQPDTNKFKSSEIAAIPEIFKKWTISNISLTEQWRSHPSGSFTITSLLPNKEEILSEFFIGKEIDLGNSYRIGGITWEEFPLSDKLVVNIELQGYWQSRGNTIRSPLDKPIRLLDLAKAGKSYYLSQLASKAGAKMSGVGAIKIKVPKGTGETESTTLGSEIERVIVQGDFLDYNSKSAIASRKYDNQPVHLIENYQVRDETLSFTANGHGAEYEGIKLAYEYSHVKLDIQSDKEDENESKTGVKVVLRSGDLEPFTLPTTKMNGYEIAYSLDYLRSPSNSFDNGGATKTLKTSYLIDGTTIKEVEETYGFLYTSLDTYAIDGDRISYGAFEGLAQFWTKVKEVTTIYNYRKDGYLENAIATGWEYFRERKESGEKPEEFELIKLQKELNDVGEERDENGNLITTGERALERARIIKNMALYRLKKRSLTVPTTYELESKKSFYKDLQSADPEPYYVKRQISEENNLTITPDPDSTAENPKPAIVSGVQKIDKIENAIASPIGLNQSQSPEVFKSTQLTQTKEGANFQNFASQSNYQENLGRPSDQQYFKQVEPSDEVKEEKDEQEEKDNYYVSTPDAPFVDKRIYPQSISFTGADSLSKLLLAARADLCMKNTESLTLTLNIDRDLKYRTGDRVSYRGYLWTVKGINDEQDVRGNMLISTSYKLNLGIFLDVPLTINNE